MSVYCLWPAQTETAISRVLFEGKKAIGVEVEVNDNFYKIYTKKGGEIILSSGAYGSPRLLMKSGIGPIELLNKFKGTIIPDTSMCPE